ncbi:MAG: BTAD domain-containing putative transcriptional regulator [bacterium]
MTAPFLAVRTGVGGSMFQLRTFGGLTLEWDGAPYLGPAAQRRRLALLAVLASADAPVSRDRLMTLLWPDADPDRARHSLDDALSALRRELRNDTLFLGVASLRLNPEAIESDVADHAAALKLGDEERAVELYMGPFLDGFYIPNAGDFERWVESERARRTQLHLNALDRLAVAAVARDDRTAAVRWSQARVVVDPLDTAASLRLVRALAVAGSHAEALRVARVHESLLREELDMAPGPEWSAAVTGLKTEMARAHDEPPALVVGALPSIAKETAVAQPEPKLFDAIASVPMMVVSADAVPPSLAPMRPRRRRTRLLAGAVLLVIGGGGYGAWLSRTASLRRVDAAIPVRATAPRTSVAVLPFAYVGSASSDEPFADGLTDELISALSKVSGIRVTGRTSAFALKGRGLNVRTIADTLGVGSVLEGSVRRAGDRLRITAQLVSAGDNAVIWAESYDRNLADVFAVQAEIAHAITNALLPTLGHRSVPTANIRTPDLATYELYLKGRYFLGRRTPGDLVRAAAYFEQAVTADSAFAQAYAGLADAHVLLVLLGDSSPEKELPRAREAAATAIRLDSTLAEAHAALGNIHEAFDWDASAADKELTLAMALDPGYATAQLYHGIHLLNRGRFDEATTLLAEARTLDPLSAPVRMQLGRLYVSAHRPDLALPFLQSAVELSPGFSAAYLLIGDAYLQQHDNVSALRAFRRAAVLNGGRDSAQIAFGLAVTGQRDSAMRVLGALVAVPQGRYLPPVPIAKAYVALGDVNAAFRWLERGYDQRAAQMHTIKVTPAFDPLHTDPRWARLLRRMGVER